MKRMALIITLIITLALVCMPAWAGTFKEDFSRGDLAGWQFEGIPEIVTFQVESGQLIAEMDLDILVKKGKVAPWDPLVNTFKNSTWLYTPIQLEGSDFSISCRLQFLEKNGRIGMALQTERQEQGEMTTWDTYMIGLLLFEWEVEIEHTHIEINGPRFPQGILYLGNSYAGLKPRLFLRPQVWYRLKVEVKPPDKHLKVFVNDILFEEFAILRPNQGLPNPANMEKISLSATSDGRKLSVGINLWGRKMKALFDDLVLESPSIRGSSVSVHPKSKLTTAWGKIKASR
jgi:hypothetical protein